MNRLWLKMILYLVTTLAATTLARDQSRMTPTPTSSLTIQSRFDSLRAVYLTFPSHRPRIIFSSEKRLKWQLIKLVFMAHHKYLNSYETLDNLFLEMDRFPNSAKKRMLFLAVAGAAGREIIIRSQRKIRQHRIKFLYLNMAGVNFTHYLSPLRTNLYLRISGPHTFYSNISLYGGKLSTAFLNAPTYFQRIVSIGLNRRISILGMQTFYPYSHYNGIGLAHYSRTFRLYVMVQKNMRWERKQVYIDWEFILR